MKPQDKTYDFQEIIFLPSLSEGFFFSSVQITLTAKENFRKFLIG